MLPQAHRPDCLISVTKNTYYAGIDVITMFRKMIKNPMARDISSPIDQAATRTPFARLLRKLLVGFIASGIVMLAIFSFKSWEEENQDMRRNLAIQAGFAEKNSQAVFDNLGTSMEMLGIRLEKMDITDHSELARSILNEFQSSHPGILAMTLVSPNGVTLLSNQAAPGEVLPDFRRDAAYLRAFLFDLNNTYSYNIGRNQFGMGLNQWHFPFRHTVQDSHGDPLFVIQAAISADIAGFLWSDLPLYPESRVGLMRNDGYIQLLWPRPESEQVLNKPQTGALIQTLRANPGMISGAYEGKSSLDDTVRLGAFSHLPNANMSAFVSVSKKLIMIRWWEHNYPILLSFLVYLGVIGSIAFKLSVMERQHTHDLLAQSRKDPLTGLPNRIAIDEILAREIARNRRGQTHSAILYLDLDKFKDINDNLGHSSGDRLLERVAMRIRAILRVEDVLARLGGDEFLILLPNSNAEKSSLVAERLIEVFGKSFRVSDQDLLVSTSIGICVFPDNGDDSSTLLQNADAAMYEAKRQGRNRFVFYRGELGEKIRQRLQLQHDFLRALKLQEFFLHYQPLVDLSSGKIVGAEALVRWLDPQRGLRNPAEFIPFAEETGVILPLGEWVLNTACREAKSWADQGYDIHIAVNLSARQFQDPDLFSKISNALSEAELPPANLELEITESASMQDPEASILVMDKLKSIGIKISIDDFGTGYSSLAYLKRIPADTIKIDRSFVNGIQNDPDDLAIVRAILALGNSLEKRCLAEGIETAENFETLNNLGCHFGQGYWMSKPIPALEFSKLLKEDVRYLHQNPAQSLTA
ncbi:MAG: EAL domain-containing protein [Gammaproteobacteria bacterium]|nr:EAL domain-containing protein [Gammaproteobacteria bacterium]